MKEPEGGTENTPQATHYRQPCHINPFHRPPKADDREVDLLSIPRGVQPHTND